MSNQERFSGEWETKRLGEIVDCLDSVRIPLNETQRANMQGPYPYCGANGVLDYVNNYVLDDDVILIAEDGGYFDEYLTRPIAYRMRGKIWVNNHAHILKAKSEWDQGFLYFSLVHKNILPYLSGGTRAKLNKFEMYKIEFSVPDDIEEQRAIAEVLSDVDGLIASLEALIAKKRAIKQATMQQLLTGKTRLPGFSGDWETKRLGEIATIKTGSKNNEDKDDNGQYPLYVRSAVVERINSYCYDGEAILVPGEGGIESIFHYINGRFDCHQRVYMINRFADDVFGKLIYYTMVLQFGRHAMQNTVKATVDSLRLPTFQTFSFSIPMDITEQRAIATVFTDIDTEITALEQRRDKSIAIKQGMMQQLLTGKVRLLKSE